MPFVKPRNTPGMAHFLPTEPELKNNIVGISSNSVSTKGKNTVDTPCPKIPSPVYRSTEAVTKDLKKELFSVLEATRMTLDVNTDTNKKPPIYTRSCGCAPKKFLLKRASLSGLPSSDGVLPVLGSSDVYKLGALVDIDNIVKLENPSRHALQIAGDTMSGINNSTNKGLLDFKSEASTIGDAEVSKSEDMTVINDRDTPSIPNRIRKTKHKQRFSEKLMNVLSQEDAAEGITWLPDGNAFVIVNQNHFVSEVMPKYFKEAKYESFLRKLKRWGFKRTPRDVGNSTFYHKDFVRDSRDLCKRMRSNSVVMACSDSATDSTLKFNSNSILKEYCDKNDLRVNEITEAYVTKKGAHDAESCPTTPGVKSWIDKTLLGCIKPDGGNTSNSFLRTRDILQLAQDISQRNINQLPIIGSHASNITRSILQHGFPLSPSAHLMKTSSSLGISKLQDIALNSHFQNQNRIEIPRRRVSQYLTSSTYN